ncbi:MAG: hypothetical protein BGO43_03210 [Gammaproteobacteria bacterium 39-13]|nr:hypothetical protein [Gammaproteobacteria bacterium]OJV87010.1 MAG: hypothetical protein BGO43_03210 [Gammaproteobacteria bacterium 39-13]
MLLSIVAFINGTLDLWEGGAAILGTIFTLLGIKEVWAIQGRQKYGLISRIGLTAFYALHIVAILLASGLIAEALIAAPLATALVSVTTLVSDSFDYLQEYYQNYKTRQKLRLLQNRLAENNIDFKEHMVFFEEIAEQQDEIELLNAQLHELSQLKDRIDLPTEDPSWYVQELKQIATVLKRKHQLAVNEAAVVNSFYSLYGDEIKDEYEIIQNTEIEANALKTQKAELQAQLISFQSSAGHYPIEIARLTKEISLLDADLKKIMVINQHFYKLKKSTDALREAQTQLKGLVQKYRKGNFAVLDFPGRLGMKQLEKKYLENRIKSLTAVIYALKNPKLEQNTSLASDLEYQTLIHQQETPQKNVLKKIIDAQIKSINKMLKGLDNAVKEKKEYMQLFSIDPKRALPKNLSNIFKTTKAIFELQNELELAKLEENQKLWSTRYSVITASMAFVLCYTSLFWVSSTLTALLRFFGVMTGLSSMFGYIEQQRARNRIQAQKNEQLNKLISDFSNGAAKVKDPHSQAALNNKLYSIINKLQKDENKHSSTCTETSVKKKKSSSFNHQFTRHHTKSSQTKSKSSQQRSKKRLTK